MDNNNNFDSSANTDMIEFHDCEDVVARFGDYVDNDLLRPERLAVEAHINDCPACAAFLASYNHVIDSAAELREPEQPIQVDVQNRLRKALNQRLGLNLSYIA
jgi:anti-sigma factor RsiW